MSDLFFLILLLQHFFLSFEVEIKVPYFFSRRTRRLDNYISLSKNQAYSEYINFEILYEKGFLNEDIVIPKLVKVDEPNVVINCDESIVNEQRIDVSCRKTSSSNVKEGKYYIKLKTKDNEHSFEKTIIEIITQKINDSIKFKNANKELSVSYFDFIIETEGNYFYELVVNEGKSFKSLTEVKNKEISFKSYINSLVTIILFNEGSSIDYIGTFKIIDENIFYIHDRKNVFYLRERTGKDQYINVSFNITVSFKLEDSISNQKYLDLIEKVTLKGKETSNEIVLEKGSISQITSEKSFINFSKRINNEKTDEYEIIFSVFGKSSTATSKSIFIVDSLNSIIDEENFVVPSCFYYEDNLNITVQRKIFGVNMSLVLQQDDYVYQYYTEELSYNIPKEKRGNIGPGKVILKLIEENDFENPLVTRTIYFKTISYTLDDEFPMISSLIVSRDSEHNFPTSGYYLENIITQYKILLNCEEGKTNCEWEPHENFKGGKYSFKTPSGIIIKNFDLFENYTKEIMIQLPEIVYDGLNKIEIKAVDIDLVEIIKIKNTKDNAYLTYFKKVNNFLKPNTLYFNIEDDQSKKIVLFVNVSEGDEFFISEIIFSNYKRKNFEESNLILSHKFELLTPYIISSRKSFTGSITIQVTDKENKISKDNIYFKVKGKHPKNLICEWDASNIICQLDNFALDKESYGFIGIGENLISSQKVYLLTYTLERSCIVDSPFDKRTDDILSIYTPIKIPDMEVYLSSTENLKKIFVPKSEKDSRNQILIYSIPLSNFSQQQIYTINCLFSFTLRGQKSSYIIPLQDIRVEKYFKIGAVLTGNVFYISDKNKNITLQFEEPVKKNEILGLSLSPIEDKNRISFFLSPDYPSQQVKSEAANEVTDEAKNEMVFYGEFNFVSGFQSGRYEIQYISSCQTAIQTMKEIYVRNNIILNETISLKKNSEKSIAIEYKYPINANKFYLIFYKESKKSLEVPLSIGFSENISFLTLKGADFEKEGTYQISTKIRDNEEMEETTLLVYTNDISIKETGVTSIPDDYSTLTIELKEEIMPEQIKEISIKKKNELERIYPTFQLKDKKSISIYQKDFFKEEQKYDIEIKERTGGSQKFDLELKYYPKQVIVEEVDVVRGSENNIRFIIILKTENMEASAISQIVLVQFDKILNTKEEIVFSNGYLYPTSENAFYPRKEKKLDLYYNKTLEERLRYRYYISSISINLGKTSIINENIFAYEDVSISDSLIFPKTLSKPINLKSELTLKCSSIEICQSFKKLIKSSKEDGCNFEIKDNTSSSSELVAISLVCENKNFEKPQDITFKTINGKSIFSVHFVSVDTICKVNNRTQYKMTVKYASSLPDFGLWSNNSPVSFSEGEEKKEKDGLISKEIIIDKDFTSIISEPESKLLISKKDSTAGSYQEIESYIDKLVFDSLEVKIVPQNKSNKTLLIKMKGYSSDIPLNFSLYSKNNELYEASPFPPEKISEDSVYIVTFYNLDSKKDTNEDLKVFYSFDSCSSLDSGVYAEFSSMPAIIIDISVKQYKKSSQDKLTIELFLLEDSNSNKNEINEINLVKEDSQAETIICNIQKSNVENKIICEVEDRELHSGIYFLSFPSKDILYSSTILVYENETIFKNSSILKFYHQNLKGTEYIFEKPILVEQVKEVYLLVNSKKKELSQTDFSVNSNSITLMISFEITPEISSLELAIKDVLDKEAKINFNIKDSSSNPDPDFEITPSSLVGGDKKYSVYISSTDCNVEQIENIELSKKSLNNTSKIINLSKTEFMYSSIDNTLSFDIKLNEPELYTIEKIKSKKKKINLIRRPDTDDIIYVPKKTGKTEGTIKVYTFDGDEEASEIFMKSVVVAGALSTCQKIENKNYYECKFNLSDSEPKIITVSISDQKIKDISVVNYEFNDTTCKQIITKENTKITLNFSSPNDIISTIHLLKGNEDDEITSINPTRFKKTNFFYVYEFDLEIPPEYEIYKIKVPTTTTLEYLTTLNTTIKFFPKIPQWIHKWSPEGFSFHIKPPSSSILEIIFEESIVDWSVSGIKLIHKDDQKEKFISCVLETDEVTFTCKIDGGAVGRYELFLVDGCGNTGIKSEYEFNLEEENNLIDYYLTKRGIKIEETTKHSIYFIKDIANSQISKIKDSFKIFKGDDFYKPISLDKSKIVIKGNILEYEFPKNIEPGNYRPVLNFQGDYHMRGYLLLYQNEISFKKESNNIIFSENLTSFDIDLNSIILAEQIRLIHWKKESENKLHKANFSLYDSEKKINVSVGSELIDDNFIFYIRDINQKIYEYHLEATKIIKFNLLNTVGFCDFEKNKVASFYLEFEREEAANLAKNHIYLKPFGGEAELIERKPELMMCKQVPSKIKQLVCQYYFSELTAYDTIISYRYDGANLHNESASVSKYVFHNFGNELTKTILRIGTKKESLIFFLNSKEVDRRNSIEGNRERYIEIDKNDFNRWKGTTSQWKFEISVAYKENEEKIVLGSIYYITEKKILDKNYLLISNAQEQTLQITFDSPISGDDEVKYISLKDGNEGIRSSNYCKKVEEEGEEEDKDKKIECGITLDYDILGKFSLEYTNAKGESYPNSLGKRVNVIVKPKFTIAQITPNLIDISQETTVKVTFNEKLPIYGKNVVKNIALSNSEVKKDFPIYSATKNSLFFKANKLIEGEYKILLGLSGDFEGELFEEEDNEKIIFYDKSNEVFKFNRTMFIIDEEKCKAEGCPTISIKITPEFSGVESIKCKNSGINLTEDGGGFVYETSDYSTDNKEISFEYQKKGKSYYVPIDQKLFLVKNASLLFTLESELPKCLILNGKYTIKLKPLPGINLENVGIFLEISEKNYISLTPEKKSDSSSTEFSLVYNGNDITESANLLIVENNDTDKPLKIIEQITFVSINPPDFIFRNDEGISLSVFKRECHPSIEELVFTLEGENQSKNITFIRDVVFGNKRYLYFTDQMVLNSLDFGFYKFKFGGSEIKTIYLSQSLRESIFNFTHSRFNSSLITLQSDHYYMGDIKMIVLKNSVTKENYEIEEGKFTFKKENPNQLKFVFDGKLHNKYFLSRINVKEEADGFRNFKNELECVFYLGEFPFSFLEKETIFYFDSGEEKRDVQFKIKTFSLTEEEVQKLYVNSETGKCELEDDETATCNYTLSNISNIKVSKEKDGSGDTIEFKVIIFYISSGNICNVGGNSLMINAEYVGTTSLEIDLFINNVKGQNYSQRINGENVIQTFEFKDIEIGKNTLFINGKNPIKTFEFYNSINIKEVPSELEIKKGGTLPITLGSKISNEKINITANLKNCDGGSEENSSECTLKEDNYTIECKINIENKLKGRNTFSYINQCGEKVKTDFIINVIQKQNELINTENISVSKVDKKPTYFHLRSDFPLVKKVILQNDSSNIFFEEFDKSKDFILNDLHELDEGIYSIYFEFNEQGTIFKQSQKVIVYKNKLKIKNKTEKLTLPSLVKGYTIELENPVFNGQIEQIKMKQFGRNETVGFVLDDRKIIITSSLTFEFIRETTYTFYITDAVTNKEEVQEVIVESIPSIEISKYLYITNETPSVKVKGYSITGVAMKVNGKIFPTEKVDNYLYVYEPHNSIEKINVFYMIDNEYYDSGKEIYVASKLGDLFVFVFESCLYYKEPIIVRVLPKDNDMAINYKLFSIVIESNDLTQETQGIFELLSHSLRPGNYRLKISYNGYSEEKTISLTDLKVKEKYLEFSGGNVDLDITSTCSVDLTKFKINSIAYNYGCCQQSKKEEVKCSFDRTSVKFEKSNILNYSNFIIEENISISLPISEATFIINSVSMIRGYKVSIRSNDFDVSKIDEIIFEDEDGDTDKNITYSKVSKSGTIEFSIINKVIYLFVNSKKNYYKIILKQDGDKQELNYSLSNKLKSFKVITCTSGNEIDFPEFKLPNVNNITLKAEDGIVNNKDHKIKCKEGITSATVIIKTDNGEYYSESDIIIISDIPWKNNISIPRSEMIQIPLSKNSSRNLNISLLEGKIKVKAGNKKCQVLLIERHLQWIQVLCDGIEKEQPTVNATINVTTEDITEGIEIQKTTINFISCQKYNKSDYNYSCDDYKYILPDGKRVQDCPEGYLKDDSDDNKNCFISCGSEEVEINGICKKNDNCGNNSGFFIKGNKKCYDCSIFGGFTNDGYCVKECQVGLYLKDNKCLSPADMKSEDCKKNGYCGKNGDCKDFYGTAKCECKPGYHGVTCKTPENLAPLVTKNLIEELLENSEFNFKSKDFTSSILDIISFFESNTSFFSTIDKERKRDLFYKISEIIQPSEDIDASELNLRVKLFALWFRLFADLNENPERFRNIDETPNVDFTNVIKYAKDYNRIGAIHSIRSGDNEFYFFPLPFNQIYFSRWTKNSYNEYVSTLTKENLSVVDLINTDNNFLFLSTEIDKDAINLPSSLPEEKLSNMIDLTVLDLKTMEEVSVNQALAQGEFKVKIPMLEEIDSESYSIFKKQGIDIYNPEDPAYTDECYKNSNLTNDYTPKYRKTVIFKNKTLVSMENTSCKFESVETEEGYAVLSCVNGNNIGYIFKEGKIADENKNNDIHLIQFKCIQKVDDIEKNSAFLIIISIYVVLILATSLVSYLIYKNYLGLNAKRALKNDKIVGYNASETGCHLKTRESREIEEDPINEIQNNRMEENNNESEEHTSGSHEANRAQGGLIQNSEENKRNESEENQNNSEQMRASNTPSRDAPPRNVLSENAVNESEPSGNPAPGNAPPEIRNNPAPPITLQEIKKNDFKTPYQPDINRKKNHFRNFWEDFVIIFHRAHPLLSITRHSLIMPIPLSLLFLFTNIILAFGLNAVFYNEKLFEKRIDNSKRDNFTYPLTHEYLKIIFTILLMIVFNIIVRAISVVTINFVDKLERKIEKEKNKNNKQKIDVNKLKIEMNKFSKKIAPRRIIAIVICLVLMVIFSIYCIVFCDINRNTQYSLIYSAVWTLLIIWVVLSPIYILIITVIYVYLKTNSSRADRYVSKISIF